MGGEYVDDLKGKRLLILGGTSASLDVVNIAKSMGIHVTVTDDAPTEQRVAKLAADGTASISTCDLDGLTELIRERRIDGVFCGPSEFNIKNMIRLCEKAKLPCYATETLWNRCADKTSVKTYCKKHGVGYPEEYGMESFFSEGADVNVRYPVAVKPADGCSSKGITVCYNRNEVMEAAERAREYSVGGKVFAERYIDNGGRLFNVRYLINEGEFYPYLAIDTFISDPYNKKRLISALSRYPSRLYESYMRSADGRMRKMLSDMGLRNGTVFIQMLPEDGEFYCMDMGYRLSGGLFYKLTEPMMGISDMKMMIRYALGGEMCLKSEIKRLEQRKPLAFGQLTVPLEAGRICRIEGAEQARSHPCVVDYLQYYNVGDVITEDVIGTLGQHFARISVITENEEKLIETVNALRDGFRITDEMGNELYRERFDTDRLKQRLA